MTAYRIQPAGLELRDHRGLPVFRSAGDVLAVGDRALDYGVEVIEFDDAGDGRIIGRYALDEFAGRFAASEFGIRDEGFDQLHDEDLDRVPPRYAGHKVWYWVTHHDQFFAWPASR